MKMNVKKFANKKIVVCAALIAGHLEDRCLMVRCLYLPHRGRYHPSLVLPLSLYIIIRYKENDQWLSTISTRVSASRLSSRG